MRLAKSIKEGGRLLLATEGDYSTAIERTLVCLHCNSPVFWKSGFSYRTQIGKKIITHPCWVHYPGGDKNCPLYFGGQSNSKNVCSGSLKGQREKLLLAKFWQVVGLGVSQGIVSSKAERVWNKLIANAQIKKEKRIPLPLPESKLKEYQCNQFLELITEKIKGDRLTIIEQITGQKFCPQLEKSIAAEAFEFLLIPKNTLLLNRLILCGLGKYEDISVTNLGQQEFAIICEVVSDFILNCFIGTNFSQAYLLLEKKDESGK